MLMVTFHDAQVDVLLADRISLDWCQSTCQWLLCHGDGFQKAYSLGWVFDGWDLNAVVRRG